MWALLLNILLHTLTSLISEFAPSWSVLRVCDCVSACFRSWCFLMDFLMGNPLHCCVATGSQTCRSNSHGYKTMPEPTSLSKPICQNVLVISASYFPIIQKPHFPALETEEISNLIASESGKACGRSTLALGQEQHGVLFRLVGLVEPKRWCRLAAENECQFLLCARFNCSTWKSLVHDGKSGVLLLRLDLWETCLSGKMVRVSLPSLQLRRLSAKYSTLFTFLRAASLKSQRCTVYLR